MTYVIGADHNLSNIPCDIMQTLFGETPYLHETKESALAAIAQLDRAGDWPDGRPTYRLGSVDMPIEAARALFAQVKYDPQDVLGAWIKGDYGDLTDSETGETLRKATRDEAIESLTASYEGHIDVGGRDCYVSL